MARKRITIGDVAEAAGVSRQTVSRVLNGRGEIRSETRQRVRAVIERLGYRPNVIASSLAAGHARNIGLAITSRDGEPLSNPFFLLAILGTLVEARRRNYGLVVRYPSVEEVTRLREDIFGRGQVDGILILRAHQDFAAAFGPPVPDRLPVLLVGEFPPDCPCPFIGIDNAAGSRLVAEHLDGHGYRHVAIISHSPAGVISAGSRVHSLLDALRRRGLSVDPEATLWTNSTLPDAYDKAFSLARGPHRPDAIVTTNDWTAMAVIHATRDAGLRVPEDIAVIGFDDLPLAGYLEPPLTTVLVSGFDIAQMALDRLICHIETGIPPEPAYLPARLIVRRSCGCGGARGMLVAPASRPSSGRDLETPVSPQ